MTKLFLVSKPTVWSGSLNQKLQAEFDTYYFTDNSYKEALLELQPNWVFFFHWSEMVSSDIYENNKCVVIHTSNLPKGRGGSPLQNQILDGIVESRVNAITMGEKLDCGEIYASLPITLQGSITDIWLAMADRAFELIKKCVRDDPKPTPQMGESQIYKRNKNNQLPLDKVNQLIDIHKFIQMLDGESYPNAYFETENFILEFSRSQLSSDAILADVRIRKKE